MHNGVILASVIRNKVLISFLKKMYLITCQKAIKTKLNSVMVVCDNLWFDYHLDFAYLLPI